MLIDLNEMVELSAWPYCNVSLNQLQDIIVMLIDLNNSLGLLCIHYYLNLISAVGSENRATSSCATNVRRKEN